MSKPLILNPAQAEAVYSAMCALNNVSGRIKVQFPQAQGDEIRLNELDDGEISIVYVERFKAKDIERHADQTAFATAYGLDESADDTRGHHYEREAYARCGE